jgi:hypothetical protein
MCTYWLADKVGGLPKKEVELSIPGFFKQAKDSNVPEYIHDIFGSSGSEDGEECIKKNAHQISSAKIQPLSSIHATGPSRVPLGIRNSHL